jgi:hypothetical protein
VSRREALEKADELLQLAQQQLEKDPGSQVAAYTAFGLALEAAGHARALGDERALRKRLRAAAEAGLAVLRLAGTAESTVVELPEGEETTFTDTSAANPWTYLRALYAAAAAEDEETLETLSRVEPERLQSDQVEASPAMVTVASAARRLAARSFDAAGKRRVEAAIAEYVGSQRAADRYWVAQLSAVNRIVDGDEDGLRTALKQVADTEHEWWHDAGRSDAPEALIGLPALGLQALADRGP